MSDTVDEVQGDIPHIREGESVIASVFVPSAPESEQKYVSVLLDISVTDQGRLRITTQQGVLFLRPVTKDVVDIYPRVYLGKGAQL